MSINSVWMNCGAALAVVQLVECPCMGCVCMGMCVYGVCVWGVCVCVYVCVCVCVCVWSVLGYMYDIMVMLSPLSLR